MTVRQNKTSSLNLFQENAQFKTKERMKYSGNACKNIYIYILVQHAPFDS